MTKRRRTNRFVTIGGLVALGIILAYVAFLQADTGRNNNFKRSIDAIAVDAIALTREYQAEEGKWTNKQYDNTTMVAVIDQYDPRYESLVERARSLDTPEKYQVARDTLIKAIDAEKQSNIHFRNYISSGSTEEYERSVDQFSLSLQYSADYDSLIVAAG